MTTLTPAGTSTRRKLLWLAGVRAATAVLVLGAAIVLRTMGAVPDVAEGSVDPFFGLIAMTFLATGVCAFTVRFVDRWPWIVDAQVATDAALVSLLVFVTGGLDSFFTSLYVLPIVGASIVQFSRGGLLVAGLSSLSYALIVVGQYSGAAHDLPVLSLVTPALPPPAQAMYRVALSAAGFLAVGALVGQLADGWRSADAQLAAASTEIADLQAFNEHIIDSLTGGLVTATPDGRIATFNLAAEVLTGVSRRAASGRHVREVLRMPAGVFDSLVDAATSGRQDRFEYRFDAGAQERLFGISASRLRTGASSCMGLVMTFQDVTMHRQREQDDATQRRLAALGEMAAGIAHEIRNPLGSIAGSIQMLQRDLVLTPEQSTLLTIVLRESERLNATITDFLVYARPQHRLVMLIDVRLILDETATLLLNSAERRPDHMIRVDGLASVVYPVDGAQMRQVVWNLATNGLRAMPSGGTLSMSVDGDAARGISLRVADGGVGIDPASRETLFEPFKSGFAAGTGLGLALVHRVIETYGGHISVTSAPGVGTTIEVVLPPVVDAASARDVA